MIGGGNVALFKGKWTRPHSMRMLGSSMGNRAGATIGAWHLSVTVGCPILKAPPPNVWFGRGKMSVIVTAYQLAKILSFVSGALWVATDTVAPLVAVAGGVWWTVRQVARVGGAPHPQPQPQPQPNLAVRVERLENTISSIASGKCELPTYHQPPEGEARPSDSSAWYIRPRAT